jgi:hypothetical protein
MRSIIHVAGTIVAAFVGLALGIICAFGFWASFEYGYPNIDHLLYGVIGCLAVATATVLVIFAASKPGKGAPGGRV